MTDSVPRQETALDALRAEHESCVRAKRSRLAQIQELLEERELECQYLHLLTLILERDIATLSDVRG